MVSLTIGRLHDWPRMLACGVALAAAVLTIGLLVGATAASSTTTLVRTVTSTVTVESPAQAARIGADARTIRTLHRRLALSRRRLTRAERALAAQRRGRPGGHARHVARRRR